MSQVGDYDVANASGASVRSDLNFILGAIKTSNSGSNDPSNPEAFMFYGDSGDNKLKIYDGSQFRPIGEVNKDNLGLLPRSGGTTAPMTGQFLADSGGTASAPAIAFGDGSNSANNDTDTGLYRVSANIVGITCSGGTSTNQANFEFSSSSFISREDITLDKTGADASLQINTNSNSHNAIIDLASDTTTLGSDFGLRLIRSGGTDGFSKLHHRSDSATANNLIIESQATSSGGIVLMTGGTPHVTPASEVASKSRFAIAHNGTVLTGEAIRINQDPVTATGNVGSGIKVCGPATASTEYDGFGMSINAKDIVGIFNRTNTTGTILEFKYNGSVVGYISTNGSATTYNPSSDYRLKQDINNIDDAITKIKTLRPVTFRWKNNVEIGYDSGFIAHEVQETGHYNHLVTGVKDGTRTSYNNPEENEPEYQGVDYSKFTPMLVAALQEAVAKIETLETKVAALEAS
jgi:hypothetical protein